MEDRVDRWNDDRLDELSRRMDEGFKEMREGFARVDERFVQVDERFDRLLHMLALISWGVAGTLLAALISVLVAVLL